MRPATLIRRTSVALTFLVATIGTCQGGIILGPIAPDAAILQLPQQAATHNPLVGTDPTIGQFTFSSANRLRSDAATDRLFGIADFEDLTFQAANPGIIVGLSFQFSAPLILGQSAELRALDQSGRSFLFTFPGPISGLTTVSLLATAGETISGFSLSSPILGRIVGPFRVSTVPEPSTLALGLVGMTLAGLGWARRRAAA